MDAELIKFFLGGGVAILLGAIGKFIYDIIQGPVIKEDSAVAQGKGIAEARLQELQSLKKELRAYKSAYAKVWHAYSVGPPAGVLKFPFIPDDIQPDEYTGKWTSDQPHSPSP